jgi:hypothetical protein
VHQLASYHFSWQSLLMQSKIIIIDKSYKEAASVSGGLQSPILIFILRMDYSRDIAIFQISVFENFKNGMFCF